VKSPRLDLDRPPILYGAVVLAVLSLAWSGYAITDLMHSGKFGLSVALAGDIGWITVLWAEYKGVRIAGYRWPASVAGWLIAAGVTDLLVVHGAEHSRAQAIAGPFVVLVGKIVWLFALAALKDPTALTPEQEAEIHAVMRDSEYEARLGHARTDAAIARIRDQARTVLARDEADFEISLERLDKRAEIDRRTPLALTSGTPQASFDRVAEQAIEVVGEHDREHGPSTANTIASNPNMIREQLANSAVTSPNADREQPSIADLVREQIANTTDNATAVRNVLAARPDANKESVAASVRRERKKAGPYL
jgi:hypothetical protein